MNVIFIADYGFFSKEDIKWNNYTFTWLENIQPILKNTELKLIREKENWIVSLKDKRSKLSIQLNECLAKVKELKQRDRISEGDVVLKDLMQISSDVERFKREVCIVD